MGITARSLPLKAGGEHCHRELAKAAGEEDEEKEKELT